MKVLPSSADRGAWLESFGMLVPNLLVASYTKKMWCAMGEPRQVKVNGICSKEKIVVRGGGFRFRCQAGSPSSVLCDPSGMARYCMHCHSSGRLCWS